MELTENITITEEERALLSTITLEQKLALRDLLREMLGITPVPEGDAA